MGTAGSLNRRTAARNRFLARCQRVRRLAGATIGASASRVFVCPRGVHSIRVDLDVRLAIR